MNPWPDGINGFLSPKAFDAGFRGSVRQTLWVDPESESRVVVTEVFDDEGRRLTQHHLFEAEHCPHLADGWRVAHAVAVMMQVSQGMVSFGRAGAVRRFNNRFVAVTPVKRGAIVHLDPATATRPFTFVPHEPRSAGDAGVRVGEATDAPVLARACGSVPDECRAE